MRHTCIILRPEQFIILMCVWLALLATKHNTISVSKLKLCRQISTLEDKLLMPLCLIDPPFTMYTELSLQLLFG